MRRSILWIAFLVLNVTFLSSQEPWGLEKCIKTAIKNNLSVNDSKNNIALNKLDVQSNKSSKHPNLSGSGSVGWNFGRTIDPTTNQFIAQTFFSTNYGLNSSFLIYNGGRVNALIDQSNTNLEASKKDLEQLERDLALQTAGFYLNVVFAEENLALAKTQLEITLDQLDQMDKMIQTGLRAENERIDLEVQQLQNEQNIILAENSYEVNMLQLKQIMRIDADKSIVLERPEKLTQSTDPDLISFGEVYQSAKIYQPEIAANELRLANTENDMRIAKSAYYPSLSAFGSMQSNYSNQGINIIGTEIIREEQTVFVNSVPVTLGLDVESPILEKAAYFDQIEDNLSYGFGFGLNIPIYNQNSAKINVERAKLGQLQSQNNLERTKENLKLTVQQALLDARSAKRTWSSSKKSVEARQLAFDNAKKRLEIGAVSSFEFTSIQNQLESAQIQELIDRYDYTFKIKILDFYLGKPINF